MKKLTVILLTLVLCLFAASCSGDEPVTSPDPTPAATEQAEKPDPVSFDTVIEEYEAAVREGLDPGQMSERGLSFLLAQFLAENKQEQAGYFVDDIDGDAQDELVIAADSKDPFYKGAVFAVYEMQDAKPVKKLTSEARDIWYWVGDGKLLNVFSGSAFDTNCRIVSADDLSLIEAVRYDSEADPETPWKHYEGGEWSPATEEECQIAAAQMYSLKTAPVITPFGN